MPKKKQTQSQALVAAARRGDSQAFGQLFEVYAPRVFRFLFARLDNRQDAEDLTEEVFIKVWQSLPGFRERGIPFEAFLFRIARNTLTDQYRRMRSRTNDAHLDDDHMAASSADPSEALAQNLERMQVRGMLAKLRRDYRVVLELRFLAGLSPDETAEVMGKSPGAIRVLQHRALAALGKLVKGLENSS